MKKFVSMTLALLLALTLLMTVGCVEGNKTPTGSDTVESTSETETNPPANRWASLPAAEALNQLVEALSASEGEDELPMENGKLDIDLSMGISVNLNGMQSNTEISLRISLIMEGDNLAIDGNMAGVEMKALYKDGTLYMIDPESGEKIRCTMTPEEFQSVMGELMGDSNSDGDEADGSLTMPEIPALEGMKTADIFASVTSEVDETNDDLLITCKGFNTKLAGDLAPLLQPMLEGMGLVGGGELDENGELVIDPAATLAQVVGMLNSLNEDTMQLTFCFTKDGALRDTTLDITLSMDGDEGEKTDMRLKGSVLVVSGGQTVQAPADAADYTETDWRVVFDRETAEMLGLVPDERENITLSNDPAIRERQILYIYNHFEEVQSTGAVFTVSGYIVDSYVVDEETATHPSHVGALEGMISLRNPATEEEDYATVLTFQIPVSKQGEGYPANGTYVTVRYSKIEMVESSEWGSYIYVHVADYES